MFSTTQSSISSMSPRYRHPASSGVIPPRSPTMNRGLSAPIDSRRITQTNGTSEAAAKASNNVMQSFPFSVALTRPTRAAQAMSGQQMSVRAAGSLSATRPQHLFSGTLVPGKERGPLACGRQLERSRKIRPAQHIVAKALHCKPLRCSNRHCAAHCGPMPQCALPFGSCATSATNGVTVAFLVVLVVTALAAIAWRYRRALAVKLNAALPVRLSVSLQVERKGEAKNSGARPSTNSVDQVH